MGGETRLQILDAARRSLLEAGYAGLSTRRIAEVAGVRLGHIHYHFGSKQNLVLAVLAAENDRLLERQTRMYGDDVPLWKQWEQACDYLDEDLRSGYVRVLHEMTAAGWSDPDVATAVRTFLQGWFDLLAEVAGRAERRFGGLGPFRAAELAALVGDAFLGAETMLLLGVRDRAVPHRSALRRVGQWIRELEES
jgi:AcrR family transcriptional regulator